MKASCDYCGNALVYKGMRRRSVIKLMEISLNSKKVKTWYFCDLKCLRRFLNE